MKRIVTVFVCTLVVSAFAISAWGIDRNPKSKDAEKKTDEIKEMTKEKAEKKKSRAAALSGKTVRSVEDKSTAVPAKSGKKKEGSETKSVRERYDYFMDSDNDGVDDRLQRKRAKKEAGKIEKKEVIRQRSPAAKEKGTPARITPAAKAPERAKEVKVKQPEKEAKVKERQKKRTTDKE